MRSTNMNLLLKIAVLTVLLAQSVLGNYNTIATTQKEKTGIWLNDTTFVNYLRLGHEQEADKERV